MKSLSDSKQDLAYPLQGGLLVNFNHVQKSETNMTGQVHNYWECNQVKVSLQPTKAEIVAAVMADGFDQAYAEGIADEVLTALA